MAMMGAAVVAVAVSVSVAAAAAAAACHAELGSCLGSRCPSQHHLYLYLGLGLGLSVFLSLPLPPTHTLAESVGPRTPCRVLSYILRLQAPASGIPRAFGWLHAIAIRYTLLCDRNVYTPFYKCAWPRHRSRHTRIRTGVQETVSRPSSTWPRCSRGCCPRGCTSPTVRYTVHPTTSVSVMLVTVAAPPLSRAARVRGPHARGNELASRLDSVEVCVYVCVCACVTA